MQSNLLQDRSWQQLSNVLTRPRRGLTIASQNQPIGNGRGGIAISNTIHRLSRPQEREGVREEAPLLTFSGPGPSNKYTMRRSPRITAHNPPSIPEARFLGHDAPCRIHAGAHNWTGKNSSFT